MSAGYAVSSHDTTTKGAAMTTRTPPPNEAPRCADFWKSDAQASGRFYGTRLEVRANNA